MNVKLTVLVNANHMLIFFHYCYICIYDDLLSFILRLTIHIIKKSKSTMSYINNIYWNWKKRPYIRWSIHYFTVHLRLLLLIIIRLTLFPVRLFLLPWNYYSFHINLPNKFSNPTITVMKTHNKSAIITLWKSDQQNTNMNKLNETSLQTFRVSLLIWNRL